MIVDSAIPSTAHFSSAAPGEDFSGSFSKVRRYVANGQGQSLIDFIKTLTPKYWIVGRDIALGYVFLVGTLAVAIWAELSGVSRIAVALLGAVSVGYWIAYLQLFIHEAAHWNLAANQETNDRLCNLFISWMAALEIKAYRKIHFQHHRELGKTDDSERTYFLPLNLLFLAKGLLGVLVLEVVLTRQTVGKKQKEPGKRTQRSGSAAAQLLTGIGGLTVHLIIIGTLLSQGLWGSAASWAIGLGAFFPFFGALRQLLEHRAEDAQADIDYRATNHGALARIFGDGLVANTFGGAGFNRHLLHHWEPTISYTRLPDLERFLIDTDLRSVIESRRTTYGRTFRQLFGK
jgi:fatty acid desaturase